MSDHHRNLFLAVACSLSLSPLAEAQSLLRDINFSTVDPGSVPQPGVVWNGVSYFAATTASTGSELWRSDGTAAGTYLLADIRPGTQSSTIRQLTPGANYLFFTADDGVHGRELWVTDGTPAGTRMVVDGGPVDLSEDLVAWNGEVLYGGYDSATGVELRRSDGTLAGSVLVADINPGAANSHPRYFRNIGGILYFAADGGSGSEPWVSDGTAAGTYSLGDLDPAGSSSPRDFVAFGPWVYFVATDSAGRELWRTDGTAAGTQQFVDVAPGSVSGLPTNGDLVVVGSSLFFVGADASGFREVYRTDGTVAGTAPVAPGTGGPWNDGPAALMTNGTVLFYYRILSGQLWRSDGTTAGTYLLPITYSWWQPGLIHGGELYVALGQAGSTGHLVITDGSIAGTRSLTQVSAKWPIASNGAQLLFNGNDGITGEEVWGTDGTVAGTALVANINGPAQRSSNPEQFVALGSTVLFVADTMATGRELWRTDGTTAGTTMVRDIQPGTSSSVCRELTAVSDTMFLVANEALWRSDGTAAGTQLVFDPLPNSSLDSITGLVGFGNRVLFTAALPSTGQELWISDGTAAGTMMLRDIRPGFQSGLLPTPPVVFGSKAYFRAHDGTIGAELWATDGTTAGTQLVADISPGIGISAPSGLTVYGGFLYFVAADVLSDRELWRTDGTAAGTVRVFDLNVGPAGSDISIVGQSANRLFFFATTPATGRELWSTDGTLAGTTVLDLTPGPTSSSAVATTVGDRVYLTGQELAVTDGTLAGTTTFDLNPIGPSYPLRIHPIHSSGSILFQASDGVAGRELWVSNGTAAGTRMIADINPGVGDSNPESFGRLGRHVLFAAEEPLLLREPYVLDLGTVGVPLVEPIGAGCPGTNGLIPQLAGAPAPVLGGSTQLLLTSALPASIALIAFDLQTTGLLAPCTPAVLPTVAVMLTTDASGNASMTQAWPTSITLQGTAVWAQGAVLDQAGGFLGFLSLSRGLHLLLGS